MTQSEGREWIEKRVRVTDCEKERSLEGREGIVTATQWGPFGWCLIVVLDHFPSTECMMQPDQVEEITE